ncbi:Unknown protein [Striga hermonthica]|uniref:Myb/SANT-like domain-containing protein n=1 Tax=Striga hermonthica TaxID=68872 RepID=A0A9N7MR44_STRHE|nr:Unknown protein [Striga hermonthica]
MSTSVEGGCTQNKEGEAKWPPENEGRLISLMLDQVILGKCVWKKFKTSNWMDIEKALNNMCGLEHHYEITQVTSKHDRLKVQWRQFYNMLHNTTGFGWNSATGKITGGYKVWSRWITDKDMKRRVCVHYHELTTIFNRTTATGSGARASTQTPVGTDMRRRTNTAVTPNYLFPEELSDEPMNTSDSDRCTRHRKGTTSTFNNAMNSITEASRIIQQNARPEADQKSLQHALRELESLAGVPMPVRKVAWRKFRDPWSLYTFLGLEMEENRRALLDMWMEEDGN